MGWLYRDSDFTWFDTRFDEFERYLSYVHSTLKLSSKILEKVSREPKQHINEERTGMVWESNYCEAVGVYNATFTDGPLTGREAIAKIFMQIPNVANADTVSKNPEDYADQAEDHSREGAFESQALELLTDSGCVSTPELYDFKFERREESTNPWIKGGFFDIIAMEKVPGVPLSDVWSLYTLSEEEQNRIQSAFKTAFIDVIDHGVFHQDSRLENLMWVAEKGKCYMIDFERSHCLDRQRSESPTDPDIPRRPSPRRMRGQEEWDSRAHWICYEWGLDNAWVYRKLNEERQLRDRALEEARNSDGQVCF